MSSTIRKAVIPVAGLGTRFLPATKALPKELLPIVDKPVIQYIVEEAVASGVEQVIFVSSEQKVAIENYFDRDTALECVLEQKKKTQELQSVQQLAELAEFIFVRQTEPLGLGHAVLQAKDIVGDEPFLVCGGDDLVESEIPASRQLIDVYEKYQASVIGVFEIPKEVSAYYGVIDPAESLAHGVVRLRDIVEKPAPANAPSPLAVGGRWLFTPEIFVHLESTSPDGSGEIQLTDAIKSLLQKQPVYAKQYSGVYRDCGNKLEYIKAMIAYAMKHAEIGPGIREYLKTL